MADSNVLLDDWRRPDMRGDPVCDYSLQREAIESNRTRASAALLVLMVAMIGASIFAPDIMGAAGSNAVHAPH